MESVLERIRQANAEKANRGVSETVVDGCQVKMRFSSHDDNAVMKSVQSILISSYLESLLAPGG